MKTNIDIDVTVAYPKLMDFSPQQIQRLRRYIELNA